MKQLTKFSTYLALAFVALAYISLAGPKSDHLDQIPSQAKIVDVRTPAEFQASHYPGAKNIPLNEIQQRISEFGHKESPVVVYCRSGNRSGLAKEILEKAGYVNVINGGGLRDMMQHVVDQAKGNTPDLQK